jgi:hypothetical protein
MKKGSTWLWATLAAHAVARTRAAIWPSRPGARAPRSREGGLAVAHSILVIAWQFLPATSPISGRRTPAVVCGL